MCFLNLTEMLRFLCPFVLRKHQGKFESLLQKITDAADGAEYDRLSASFHLTKEKAEITPKGLFLWIRLVV